MRNGNHDIVCQQDSYQRSYRTYEEWKRNYLGGVNQGTFGSYRTYEEWKRNLQNESKPRLIEFLPYL